MSSELRIELPAGLQTHLAELGSSAGQAAVEAATYGVEACLREHFLELQARPRQDGLASTGFWSGARGKSVAEQMESKVERMEATVRIDSAPLQHKLTGGTIRAQDYGKTYLTIPANDEAAQSGDGARAFDCKIAWVPHPEGGLRPALVAASHYARLSGKNRQGQRRRIHSRDGARATLGAGDVLYWLVKEVTHQPMADALPEGQEMEDAAWEAAQAAVDGLLANMGEDRR